MVDDLTLGSHFDIKIIDNLQESPGEGMRIPEDDEAGSDEDEEKG
jgi:hypothetical protein